MNKDFYEMQLGSVDTAAKRSRFLLVVNTTIAIIIFSAEFNFGFGFFRYFSEKVILHPAIDKNILDMQKEVIKNWVDQMMISISPFGIKFSAADAGITGGLSLFVTTFWLFYCVRRENHMIASIVKAAKDEAIHIKAYVFYGLCSSQVFGTLTKNDSPCKSLEEASDPGGRQIPGLRYFVSLLLFMPAIAMAIIMISDFLSLYYYHAIFHDPVNGKFDTVLSLDQGSYAQQMTSVFDSSFCIEIFFLTLITFILWRVNKFQAGTVNLLRDLENKNWGETAPGDPPAP